MRKANTNGWPAFERGAPAVERRTEQLTNGRTGRSSPVTVEYSAPRAPAPAYAPPVRQRRPVAVYTPPPAPPKDVPVKTREKRLMEAAKAVIDSWDSGDLADAVRCLDVVVNGGSGKMGQAVLRNLYHPSSYRTVYDATLSGDDLRRLQLLTNAASIVGPVGTTAYLIAPKEMAWAKDRLRKIREAK